jgi:hypothetical protein
MANLQRTSTTGSLIVSSSDAGVDLRVIGSGSAIMEITGSLGGLISVSDSIVGSILTVQTGSVRILDVLSEGRVRISGETLVTGALISTVNRFSKGGTIADYTAGITNNQFYVVWRAPFNCDVVAMYGWRDGGTGAEVNARRSGSAGYATHSGSNLSLTTQDNWIAFNSVQNVSYAAGDSLEIIISGSAGTPNQVSVQVDFVRK